MSFARSWGGAGGVVIFALAACGGSGTNAPATPPAPAAADAALPDWFGTLNPDDVAELTAGADKSRDAGVTAPAPAPAPVPPPPPDECTPVGVDFEKRARPKLKDCYSEGKKKDPNLQGTVKIAVEIDMLGKVKGIKIIDKTLPDPVAQCMLKVVKTTPLTEASKCPGKSLTIPVTFPTPH